jgi:hypothetical protein
MTTDRFPFQYRGRRIQVTGIQVFALLQSGTTPPDSLSIYLTNTSMPTPAGTPPTPPSNPGTQVILKPTRYTAPKRSTASCPPILTSNPPATLRVIHGAGKFCGKNPIPVVQQRGEHCDLVVFVGPCAAHYLSVERELPFTFLILSRVHSDPLSRYPVESGSVGPRQHVPYNRHAGPCIPELKPVPFRAKRFQQRLGHVCRMAGYLRVVLRPGQHRHHADRKNIFKRVLFSLPPARVGDGSQHTQQGGYVRIS